jgi:tRNA threonylcarbamoyladenosine modification (KEOPS) complex  Pcc1 subunit
MAGISSTLSAVVPTTELPVSLRETQRPTSQSQVKVKAKVTVKVKVSVNSWLRFVQVHIRTVVVVDVVAVVA